MQQTVQKRRKPCRRGDVSYTPATKAVVVRILWVKEGFAWPNTDEKTLFF